MGNPLTSIPSFFLFVPCWALGDLECHYITWNGPKHTHTHGIHFLCQHKHRPGKYLLSRQWPGARWNISVCLKRKLHSSWVSPPAIPLWKCKSASENAFMLFLSTIFPPLESFPHVCESAAFFLFAFETAWSWPEVCSKLFYDPFFKKKYQIRRRNTRPNTTLYDFRTWIRWRREEEWAVVSERVTQPVLPAVRIAKGRRPVEKWCQVSLFTQRF